MKRTVLLVLSAVTSGCAATLAPPGEPAPVTARVSVRTDRAAGEVSERYLSVALDVAQVVGGDFWSETGATSMAGDRAVAPFDFDRPRLLELTRALGPAYLRVGGSAADSVYPDPGPSPNAPLPAGAKYRLTAERWDALNRFARAAQLRLVFTLNAGPLDRDRKDCASTTGSGWCPDAASALIRHARARGDDVALWELGNEPNAFPLMHGSWLSGTDYGRDLKTARRALDAIDPTLRLAGPASAYWPRAGEVRPVLPDALREGGDALDVLTWHYYPQQSRRCPAATRRAEPRTLLSAEALDEVARWAREVDGQRRRHAPRARLWMGETGNAQCGGEPDVSDRFVSSLWWIDQLGLLARLGHEVVVRQTLAGSDYGLLEEKTLTPRPDYWASLLWKQQMGRRVLLTGVEGTSQLRVYAHCAASGRGVALAAINVSPNPIALSSSVLPTGTNLEVFRLTAGSLDAAEVRLNGEALRWGASRPPLGGEATPMPVTGLVIPPESYAFVVAPGVPARACR